MSVEQSNLKIPRETFCHNMFSKASSLKGFSPPIQRVLAANQRLIIDRPLFTQQSEQGSTLSPSPSSSKSSSFNGGDHQSKTLLEILRSVSPGVLIAGSTLGYCYLSSSSFSSVFSFADGPKQLLDNTIAEEKSSKFLFGGMSTFIVFIIILLLFLFLIIIVM